MSQEKEAARLEAQERLGRLAQVVRGLPETTLPNLRRLIERLEKDMFLAAGFSSADREGRDAMVQALMDANAILGDLVAAVTDYPEPAPAL